MERALRTHSHIKPHTHTHPHDDASAAVDGDAAAKAAPIPIPAPIPYTHASQALFVSFSLPFFTHFSFSFFLSPMRAVPWQRCLCSALSATVYFGLIAGFSPLSPSSLRQREKFFVFLAATLRAQTFLNYFSSVTC